MRIDFIGRLFLSKASGLPFKVPLLGWVCGIGLFVFLVVGLGVYWLWKRFYFVEDVVVNCMHILEKNNSYSYSYSYSYYYLYSKKHRLQGGS